MKKLLATAALLAAALVIAGPSFASAETIELTYTDTATSGTLISADLILTTTTIVGGANDGDQLITGVTGMRNGQTVTGFFAAPDDTGNPFLVGNNSTGSLVDNLIIPPDPGTLSATVNSGFVYTTVDGSFNPYLNIGNAGGTAGNYYEYVIGSGTVPGSQINFSTDTISPLSVPEPSSIVMSSLGGLMGLGYVIRRRKATVA